MIKVDLDDTYEVGKVIAMDPQYGKQYLVIFVKGNTHTLVGVTKDRDDLIEGRKVVQIDTEMGEYISFKPEPGDSTKTATILRIH